MLNRAIEQLDPKRLGWAEMEVWEKVDTQGLSFTATGRYLCGPDHLLHVDLKVHTGNTDGQFQIVSDGTTVWNVLRIGGDAPTITKWNLKKVQEVLNVPGTMPQLREDFFKAQSFAGVVPLLQNLRQQMTFTKHETERCNDQDMVKLTAEWNADLTKQMAPPPNPWPALVPRTCRLFFDANPPHWLYRIEWQGPARTRSDDSLLMQMEFRNPKRTTANGTKPPERFAGAFQFDPGKAEVTDKTKDLTEQVAFFRAQQAAAQRKASGSPSTPKKEAGSQERRKETNLPPPAKPSAGESPKTGPPPGKNR
jgi:hypothetical protein